MTRRMIAIERETTTGAVRKQTIVTNTVTNLATNQEISMDTVTKEPTNPKSKNRATETSETSAGSTAMYAKKKDIAGC